MSKRKNGFYWVDYSDSFLDDTKSRREVAQWSGGNWYIAGMAFSEDHESSYYISNVNEKMIAE